MSERAVEIFEQLEQIAVLPMDWEVGILESCISGDVVDLELLQTWLEKNMIFNEETDLLENCAEIDCCTQVAEGVVLGLKESEHFKSILQIISLVQPQRSKILTQLDNQSLKKKNAGRMQSKDKVLKTLLKIQLNEIQKVFNQVVASQRIMQRSELINELIALGDVDDNYISALTLDTRDEKLETGESEITYANRERKTGDLVNMFF